MCFTRVTCSPPTAAVALAGKQEGRERAKAGGRATGSKTSRQTDSESFFISSSGKIARSFIRCSVGQKSQTERLTQMRLCGDANFGQFRPPAFRAIIETMATRRFRDAIASRDLSQIGAASISNLARNDALSLSVPSICVKVMSGSSDSAEVGPKYLTRNGGGGVGKRKRATDYHGFIFYLIRTTMTLA